jgi:hypothetical protein
MPGMFVVTEAEAAAISIELRRLFPGVTDNAQAQECARTIAGWKPLPLRPAKRLSKLTRLHRVR